MEDTLDAARATWERGVVRYPDAAAVRADLDRYLRKHVLRVRGSDVPAFLTEVDLALCLPGCAPLLLRGQVITAPAATTLLHVLDWSAEVDAAVLTASASPLSSEALIARPARLSRVAPERAPDCSPRNSPPPPLAPTPRAPATPGVLGAMRPSGVRPRASGGEPSRPPPASPAPRAPSRPQPRELLPRPVTARDVRRLHETLSRGTWFEVLSVHYSDPPSELDAAYAAMKSELSPGSEAHLVSRELAEKLLALADRAWAVVGERSARRAYREALGVDLEQAAELKAAQAETVAVRGEREKACALFEAAIDLHPCRHYVDALRALRGVTGERGSAAAVELASPPRPRPQPSVTGAERLSTWSLRQVRG